MPRVVRIGIPGLPAYGVQYEPIKDGTTPKSDAVEYVKYLATQGGTPLAQTQRQYEGTRNLIDFVENKAGTNLPTVSKYAYTNDALGRRTNVVHTGSAFGDGHNFVWGYNGRSELTAADRYTSTQPATHTGSPYAWGYDYDAIGNRQLDGVDWDNWAGYARNALNQYTRVTRANELLEYDLDGNMTASGLISSDIDLDGDVDLSDFRDCSIITE